MDRRTLVRGVEVWVPKGELLVSSSGAYGSHGDFEKLTAHRAHRRGEGLPGAVWSTERALVWKDLGVRFAGAEFAAAAGIDTAIGMPVHRGRYVVAVVVLLLTLHCESPGCVELWDLDDELSVLRHAGGHYSGCSAFESVSQLIQFPTGTGLPGSTWAKSEPVVIPDVRRGKSFVRTGLAANSGLKLGVGLPLVRAQRVRQVVTLIAAEEKPFVRAIELWESDSSGLRQVMAEPPAGVPEPEGGVSASAQLAGTVREIGLPRVVVGGTMPGKASTSEDDKPFEIALGLPFYDDDRITKIACLMF
jgi:hypothetical protein